MEGGVSGFPVFREKIKRTYGPDRRAASGAVMLGGDILGLRDFEGKISGPRKIG